MLAGEGGSRSGNLLPRSTLPLNLRRATSDFYRIATLGNLPPLGMLLHHENVHRTHPGTPEPEVLAGSLRFAEE